MTGYSGTPLAAKLGIRPGMTMRAVNEPLEYREWLAPLPDGARFSTRASARTELVHHFATHKSELAAALRRYRKALAPTVPVWVSWPKKSSKLPTDISEDGIRALALPLGYVDIKVCAVSEVWSGLKLVVRRDKR
jgi:hypothetical protein